MRCSLLPFRMCSNKKRVTENQKGEITPSKNRHVLSFPKNNTLRKKWLQNLKRKDTDWNPDNFGVCDLHFQKEDFVSGNAPRTNTERVRVRLRAQSVPTVFPNYPKTALPNEQPKRPTSCATAISRNSKQQENLKLETGSFKKADSVTNGSELYTKLQNEMLPSGFVLVKSGSDCDEILSIRIENINEATGFPTISHNTI